MEKTLSATQARINFGQVMRSVVEEQQTIIVERSGRPQMVLVSMAEYARLKAAAQRAPWWEQVQRVRQQITAELAGRELPPAEEVIRQMREERDARRFDLP